MTVSVETKLPIVVAISALLAWVGVDVLEGCEEDGLEDLVEVSIGIGVKRRAEAGVEGGELLPMMTRYLQEVDAPDHASSFIYWRDQDRRLGLVSGQHGGGEMCVTSCPETRRS